MKFFQLEETKIVVEGDEMNVRMGLNEEGTWWANATGSKAEHFVIFDKKRPSETLVLKNDGQTKTFHRWGGANEGWTQEIGDHIGKRCSNVVNKQLSSKAIAIAKEIAKRANMA